MRYWRKFHKNFVSIRERRIVKRGKVWYTTTSPPWTAAEPVSRNGCPRTMSGGEPSSIKREFPCAARQPVPWLPPEDFLFFRERKGSKRKLTRRGFRRLQNLSAPDAFYGRLSFSFFTTPFSEGRASQRSGRLSQSGGEKAAGNRKNIEYVYFVVVGLVMAANPKLFLISRKAGKATPKGNRLTFTASVRGWGASCSCWWALRE